jgi:predicted RNA methylase
MAQLTLGDIEKIEMVTGHSILSTLVRTQLTTEYTQPVIDRVLEILDELVVVDNQLKEAVSLSFVTASRESKLNYSLNLRQIKREGTRILMEMCRLLSISLAYNKYESTSKSTVAYW